MSCKEVSVIAKISSVEKCVSRNKTTYMSEGKPSHTMHTHTVPIHANDIRGRAYYITRGHVQMHYK